MDDGLGVHSSGWGLALGLIIPTQIEHLVDFFQQMSCFFDFNFELDLSYSPTTAPKHETSMER